MESSIVNPLVQRNNVAIVRNSERVITRLHLPDIPRIPKIIDRVLALSEATVNDLLDKVYIGFIERHKNIKHIFMQNYLKIAQYIPNDQHICLPRKLYLGALFTMEYSIESAALFNPSIVPHPNQDGLAEGNLRFIMSLRATGEGHISSIVFRSGIVKKDGTFVIDPASELVETPKMRHDPLYDTHLFQLKLESMGVWNSTSISFFKKLSKFFTFDQLKNRIDFIAMNEGEIVDKETIKIILWLADSNYFIKFTEDHDISERVIFPISQNESRGIEDARFVKFTYDNGEVVYYATYTAYNGFSILPQFLITRDFLNFDILTLNGKAVQNKGMALFPRKVKGKYAMLSRRDGENNYIMFSNNIHFWDEAILLQEPGLPWEFFQIGNCGSPIELKEGWLVITHGVGAMRKYCIGAILLDLDNPAKIIARLEEPLLTPNEVEREGYVPNVVYSCGALVHNDILVLPYAMSDISSGIATIKLTTLMTSMVPYHG